MKPFSVSGWRKGQSSAVLSGLFLRVAGPGQKSDQKCKRRFFKEEEAQRGFCQQAQVVKTVIYSSRRSAFTCTDPFYEGAALCELWKSW